MPDRADVSPQRRDTAPGPLAFTFGSWFTWTATGIAFPLLGLLLIAAAGPLSQGAYESAPALAATHVATLGWVTMTIMGAAAQMAPALLGARVWAERTLPWQYLVFTSGALAIVAGLAAGQFIVVAAGGAGVTVSSWWFAVLLLTTAISGGPRRRVDAPYIPVALACFGLVMLWGTVLAANLRWAFSPGLIAAHRGLAVHLTLGLGGWFGLMVVGVFYRLVPLIHGARVANARRGAAILLAAVFGIAGVPVALATGSAWVLRLSGWLAAGAMMLFAAEVRHVLAHRRNRTPDLNVAHWYAVAGYSIVLAALGAGWSAGMLRTTSGDRLGEATVTLYLLGWVTQAIIGQLYKITPFLMWYYRATIPDVLAIPRQPAPYSPRPGRMVLWLSNLGAVGLAAGIWTGVTAVTQAAAVLFAAATFILAYMLAYRWIPPAVTGALTFEWRGRIS